MDGQIVIIFRKNYDVNRFRDLMIEAIKSGIGKKALLCSGFFQETFVGKHPYQASQEEQFASAVAQNGIQSTTVGVHNNSWMEKYRNFRNSLQKANVNVVAKYKSPLNWHAKVFILSKVDETPIFGIIGSSNITRPAIGITQPFNYECDTILWPNSETQIGRTVNSYLPNENLSPNDFDNHEFIKAPYIDENNGGLTVQQRLNKLKAEILDTDLRILD